MGDGGRGKRLIRLSSRALGEKVNLRVYVYDDLEHMRRDAEAFSGGDMRDTLAITQAYMRDDGTTVRPFIRLHRGRLGTEVVTHEMHHATTAIYGAHLNGEAPDLTNGNEPFAYLHGEMCRKLVDRLYALGYYDGDDDA